MRALYEWRVIRSCPKSELFPENAVSPGALVTAEGCWPATGLLTGAPTFWEYQAASPLVPSGIHETPDQSLETSLIGFRNAGIIGEPMAKKEGMKGNSPLSEIGPRTPQGRVDPKALPQAIFTESVAVVTAVLKAPETIDKIKALKASVEPLEVLIQTSDQVGTDHLVEVTISSKSLQGIYLEQFQLKEPKQSTLLVLDQIAHTIAANGFGDRENPIDQRFTGPILLPPAQTYKVWFKLPVLDEAEFKKAPFGKVSLIYSKLDEEKPAKKEITFRLRRKV
jgi:hypothetical protein